MKEQALQEEPYLPCIMIKQLELISQLRISVRLEHQLRNTWTQTSKHLNS